MTLLRLATARRGRRLALPFTLGRLLLGLLACPPSGLAGDPPATPPPRHDRGYYYIHDTVRELPWSIHILKVERDHRDLEFCTTLGRGDALGMSPLTEQVKHLPPEAGQPLAAINGDFYNNAQGYQGDPRDLQVRCGELVSSPTGHACFWVDPAGAPHLGEVQSHFRVVWGDGTSTPFGLNQERASDAAVLYTAAVGVSTHTSGGLELVLGPATNGLWLPLQLGQTYRARVRTVRQDGDTELTREVMVLSLGPRLASRVPKVEAGATLELSTQTTPALTGVRTAIGGGPSLVRDGQARQWSDSQPRHPRTALGWNKDYVFLVEVDGRQPTLSVGMTLPELAAYMIKLGCEQAMNLDGGGSATFWVMGTIMNNPSEGRERPGANALVLVQKKPPAK